MKSILLFLNSFTTRHALSVGAAIIIAVIINQYLFNTQFGWVVLAAFLSSLTTRGTPFRQGIILTLTMMGAIILAGFLLKTVSDHHLIFYFAGAMFVLLNTFFFINPMQSRVFFLSIVFIFVFIAALFMPIKLQSVSDQILGIAIGATVGILFAHLIFPVRLATEFRQGLIPILYALKAYSRAITESFLQHDGNKNILLEKKLVIEKSLQVQQGMYPEWVYETGFNPGLRAGFRFFLINIERVTEIYFAMNYLTKQPVDVSLIQNLSEFISSAMTKNDELIKILIEYFQYNRFAEIKSDFTSDISELEEVVRKVVPSNLELLDISDDYLTITAFVRDIKDLRKLLLQLVMALPNTQSGSRG